MRISLRSRANLFVVLVAAIMLATVLVLLATTQRMQRTAAELTYELVTVRATGELWSALLYYDFVENMSELTGRIEYEAEVERMEQQLHAQLESARARLEPEDLPLFDELARNIERFLGKPPRAEATVSPVYELGLLRSQVLALRDRTIARARETAVESDTWARTARVVGIASLLVLGGLLFVMVSNLRRHVVQPLLRLRRAVDQIQKRPWMPAPEAGVSEIREITRGLNDTVAELGRRRTETLEFVSAVAHDLRNPIQALKLATAIPHDRPLPPEPTLRARLELIARQTGRLNRMLDDLLDVTRIEAGRLPLDIQEENLTALAKDSVALHRGLSDKHQLILSAPRRPVYVRCDGTRISQVINNLVNNAIKYSPDGGKVRVIVREEPGWATVSVRDEGVGIARSELGTIFQPFRRSPTTRGEIPGIGLGLSVALRIVEAHGGTIDVESEPGRGSTFRIRLPVQPVSSPRVPERPVLHA